MRKKGLLILVFLIAIYARLSLSVEASVELDVDHKEYLESKTLMELSSVTKYQDYMYVVEEGQLYLCAYVGDEEVLTVPSRINGYDVYGIYTDTFSYAQNLKKIIIPSTVNYIYDYAFVNCQNLTEIVVDENNPVYTAIDGLLYSKDYSYLVLCPEGKKGVINIDSRANYICDFAFVNCTGVTGINIPASMIEIGDDVFMDTYSLENISVDSNNSNYAVYDGILYTKDRKRLYKCPDRINRSVIIPNTVERIEPHAFYNCEKLQTPLNIPNSVTFIGESAFEGCRELQTEITIPYSVETLGDKAFKNCINLSSIVFENGLTEIPFEAFAYCNSLTKVNIPESVKKVGKSAFFSCLGVKEVNIRDGVEIIDEHAFDWLMSLKGDVIIPDSVTTIGESAFQNSPEIDGYIIIGKNVRSIGASAFYSSYKSKGIIFKGNAPECTEYSFLEPRVTYYHKNESGNYDSILQNKKVQVYDEKPSVTYMLDGKVVKEVVQDTYGLKVTDIPTVAKEGYVFTGWYKDNKFTELFDFDSEIMENITLYANFKGIPYIEIKDNVIDLDIKSEGNIKLITNIKDKENIRYENQSNDIAIVDSMGNIKPLKVGSTTVKVKYDNIEKDVTINITSNEDVLELVDDEIKVYLEDSKAINTKFNSINSDDITSVNWTVDKEGLVIENGNITATQIGEYIVTANYKEITDTIKVNVVDNDTLKILDREIVIKEEDSYKVQIDTIFKNLKEEDIIWTSSNENIVTVNNGIIKANTFGIATITATLGDVTETCTVRVVGKDHLYLSENNLTLKIGQKQYTPNLDFYAYFNSADDIIWSSSDEDIAIVENGVVKLIGVGNVLIKGKINAEEVALNITVIEDNILKFNMVKETRKFEANSKFDLEYTLIYDGVKDGIFPIYESSNSNVIRVENNELYMISSGEATITATYNDLTTTIDVVLVPNDFISCATMGYVLSKEDEIDIDYSYYVHEQDDVKINFSTENPNVVVIDDYGKITAIGNGETNIIMSYGDLKESVPVFVSDKSNELGDVNQDGKINADDATFAVDMFKGIDYPMINMILADMNYDKKISADDAAKIIDKFKEK